MHLAMPPYYPAVAAAFLTGEDFFVACYDWRTTPYTDVDGEPHLLRAQQLVEAAFDNSGGLPVYLVGHSNGPLYALALLRSMSADWRAKYVGTIVFRSCMC